TLIARDVSARDGPTLDLDTRVESQACCAERAPRGLVIGEVRRVYLVHRRPFFHVGHHDGALHDAIHRRATPRHDVTDVVERLPRLRLYAAGHDTAGGVGPDLPREVEHVADAHDGRERVRQRAAEHHELRIAVRHRRASNNGGGEQQYVNAWHGRSELLFAVID